MGHIYTTIKVSNIERSKVVEVEALADMGATLTVIPEKVARELKLGEFKRETVESGASEIELNWSSARIGIDGREAVQDVLISDLIDRALLGAVTLKTLALSTDPLTGKLKEKRLLLY
jgi:clan AA aspartic protease